MPLFLQGLVSVAKTPVYLALEEPSSFGRSRVNAVLILEGGENRETLLDLASPTLQGLPKLPNLTSRPSLWPYSPVLRSRSVPNLVIFEGLDQRFSKLWPQLLKSVRMDPRWETSSEDDVQKHVCGHDSDADLIIDKLI